MATFRYTIKPGDTPIKLAKQFGVTDRDLLRANPGVYNFSTGMGIRIPAILPQRAGTMGFLPMNVTLATPKFTPPSLAGWNPSTFQPTGTPAVPATPAAPTTPTAGNNKIWNQVRPIYAPTPMVSQAGYGNPYASLEYERDVTTGAPKFNMLAIQNPDGTVAEIPRSIYMRDIPSQAALAGMSQQQFIDNMKANGYTMFAGQYVYVGQPQQQQQSGRINVGRQFFTSEKAYNTWLRRKKRGGGGKPQPAPESNRSVGGAWNTSTG